MREIEVTRHGAGPRLGKHARKQALFRFKPLAEQELARMELRLVHIRQ